MLIEVHSITETETPGMMTFDLTFNLHGEQLRTKFNYHVSDTAPLTLELTEWISNNPDFPVIPKG